MYKFVHIPSKSYLLTEPGEVAVDPYIVIVPVDFSNTPVQDSMWIWNLDDDRYDDANEDTDDVSYKGTLHWMIRMRRRKISPMER